MELFKFGGFFSGGEKLEEEIKIAEKSPEDLLKDLEDQRRQIVAFNREGQRAPQDGAKIEELDRQIAALKGESQKEAA